VKRLPLLILVGVVALAIAVPIGGGLLGSGADPSASPRASALAASPATEPTDNGVDTWATEPPPSEAPATPSPTPVLTDVAIVPVTHFRSTRTSTDRAEVEAVLAGTSKRYEALELVADEADAILMALDLQRPTNPNRLVLADTAAALSKDLPKHRKRLALMRAADVGPGVRALAWGKRTLFGVKRVTAAADWRLTARLPDDDGIDDFDASTTWTLFAGGDILLDRGVYQTIRVRNKGVDYPFDGGTAEITGYTCCSQFGHRVPTTRRTGNAGAVRELMTGADLAIANFENPAPNRVRWHTSGTVFSADPAILKGLRKAGIDWVSLANNHIGDAGRTGIIQTIRNLKKYDIAYSGAGRNLEKARDHAILDANGTKVAILAYDKIARSYHAGPDKTGSAPFTTKLVKRDIKAARAAGADIVIVFPHWGREYNDSPFENQQKQAHNVIEAGADMIIGNHAHWAAALEVHEGKPIWYALGNFVFDQVWSEPTMEGMTLELTFHGKDLVQARMRPHVIVDKAQPNFMDPNGDGRIVMGQVYDASKGLLPW
jgi:hypothetical protein